MTPANRTLEDLRAAALFARLSEEQLARLAAIAQPQRLSAESSLFMQGDQATAFFLLAEGNLKVYKLLRDGRSATIRHVRPRQTFAEAALFHATYPSSTETMTECLVYRFDKQETLALLLAEPELAVNLLAAMAHLLGLLNQRIEELLLPVPARLARYLLELADEQLAAPSGAGRGTVGPGAAGPGPAVRGAAGPGPAVRGAAGPGPAVRGAAGPEASGRGAAGGPAFPESPRVVSLPTTKRELAARLGTVPETLSRSFDRFKRGGVVRMSRDHKLIEILSFEKLRRLAQS